MGAFINVTDIHEGFVEAVSITLYFAPLYILCCLLLSIIIYFAVVLITYLLSEYEVEFIRIQIFLLKSCCTLNFLTIVVISAYPYQSQPQGLNIVRMLLTLFVSSTGFYASDHALFRWTFVIGTIFLVAFDSIIFLINGYQYDCQSFDMCSSGDPLWAIELSFWRQLTSITFQMIAFLLCGYLFHSLRAFHSVNLPSNVGVPDHMRQLTKATLHRRKKEAEDPLQFDKGNVRLLFDPNDPAEVAWDEATDEYLGNDRVSYPISKNALRKGANDIPGIAFLDRLNGSFAELVKSALLDKEEQ